MPIFRAPLRLVIVCSFFTLIAAAPALAQVLGSNPDATIASNGAHVIVPVRAADMSPSFAGSGRALAFGETDDALANVKSGQETAEQLHRLLIAKPMHGDGVNPGSVIGPDSRTRVNPTTVYPARATAFILFDTPDGTASCTGWMISPSALATAGHCVIENGSFFSVASYVIYPGINGAKNHPYGSCAAKNLYTTQAWAQGNANYDYAVITLKCTIGNTVGWYGYASDNAPNGDAFTVQGYPGDKPLGTQWKGTGPVQSSTPYLIYYQVDTAPGQSGSPIWHKNGTCAVCGFAIHTSGVGGTGPAATHNHGTRITAAVSKNLTAWKKL